MCVAAKKPRGEICPKLLRGGAFLRISFCASGEKGKGGGEFLRPGKGRRRGGRIYEAESMVLENRDGGCLHRSFIIVDV